MIEDFEITVTEIGKKLREEEQLEKQEIENKKNKFMDVLESGKKEVNLNNAGLWEVT